MDTQFIASLACDTLTMLRGISLWLISAAVICNCLEAEHGSDDMLKCQ